MFETKKYTVKTNNLTKEIDIYQDPKIQAKAFIFYIHGGGLVYGSKSDLPDFHIEKLTSQGYKILALDYPLAPYYKIDFILKDLESLINNIVDNRGDFNLDSLPYFLWGRSAGAYLSLLLLGKYNLSTKPLGLISYYGYGFFHDEWDKIPSDFYNSFPKVDPDDLEKSFDNKEMSASLEDRYYLYVYARQTGSWSKLFFDGRDKFFYRDFSLRTVDKIGVPIFLTHAIGDTDVPFKEFNLIKNSYKASSYIAPLNIHDYDRDTESPFTKKLIDKTIEFLNKSMA